MRELSLEIQQSERARLRLGDSISIPRPEVTRTQPNSDAAVWNYWLTRPAANENVRTLGGTPRPQTGELDLRILHRLNLRLSTIDLAPFLQVATVPTSSGLVSTITEALTDTARKQLVLDVFITPSDEQRVLIPKDKRRLSMTLDLERIRAARLSRPTTAPESMDAMIRQAALEEFGFDFRILVPGMHEVAISIVDTETAVPVQSMVARLTTSVPWPQSVSIDSSAQAYLHPGSPDVDLSLILEALEGDTASGTYRQLTAKLFYKDNAAASAPAPRGYKVIQWVSQQDIEALKAASDNFRNTVGSSKNAEALKTLGYKLARPLFDPDPDWSYASPKDAKENVERARAAREVIVALANNPKFVLPPTMLVLIVKHGSQSHFSSQLLPIGAMGISKEADSDPVFLGERFALALRLTDSDLSPSRRCPRDWYVALPRPVAGIDNALSTALTELAPVEQSWKGSIHSQSQTLDELSAWLSKPDTATRATPFVLTYVGHHSNGSLSLGADSAQGITVGDIRRDFQGSSIAILNACNSAMSEISTGMPIGMLAQRGVAAVVATTSVVDGYLAGSYLVCMESVLKEHRDALTIGQAHALTTRCLWSNKDGKGKFNYSGSALKYLLVGNPFQRICAPQTAPLAAPANTAEAKGGDPS